MYFARNAGPSVGVLSSLASRDWLATPVRTVHHRTELSRGMEACARPSSAANTLKFRMVLCRKTQSYYRVYVRENMITWQDEEDEDRIQALIKKADEDMLFILQKVSIPLLHAIFEPGVDALVHCHVV